MRTSLVSECFYVEEPKTEETLSSTGQYRNNFTDDRFGEKEVSVVWVE